MAMTSQNKMKDDDIIKALECCLNADSKCADCHFSFEMRFCKNALLKQTLNLINRLQTENKQLRVKLDDCERDIIPKLKYSLERANKYGSETEAENIQLLKENERLNKILDFYSLQYGTVTDQSKKIAEIKAESIKEFQNTSRNRLIELYEKYYQLANPPKEKTNMFYQGRAEAIWECIIANDNLVKEMIGEQE